MSNTTAKSDRAVVLSINGGSSSIKFAVYHVGESIERRSHGSIDRISSPAAQLTYSDPAKSQHSTRDIDVKDYSAAGAFLLDWLDEQIGLGSLAAVGHRVVHGMQFVQPERVTPELIAELRRIATYDPDHLPGEIALIEAFRQRQPMLPQMACFDTAFHRTMPRVASLLAIPRRFAAAGIQRYGFHGISYAYLMEQLARDAGAEAAGGRVILAHLGNGASLAAVRDGRSIDTSMGFTPAGGVPMGTRSGDLDPGVAWYLMQADAMTPAQFNDLINRQSGLLGMSETSSDMRELLAREDDDVRASEAVTVFCYQVKKWIGAFAAALGGLDTLVFAGGIGENADVVRARICDGMNFLGIDIDDRRNAAHAPIISSDASRVAVRMIRTDEQWMIAKTVCRILGLPIGE
ncbi:MAG: acetate/propionate family kinase [Pirellulales bacterium]